MAFTVGRLAVLGAQLFGGHVLALVAVSARRRPDEFAVLVAQIAGEPVDLGLGDDVERRSVA